MRRVLAALAAAWCLAGPAEAHTRSQSMSHWRVEGDLLVGRIEVDAVDVTRLYALGGDAPMEATYLRHVDESFVVTAGVRPCAAVGPAAPAPAAAGRLAAVVRYSCSAGALAGGEITLSSTLFLPVAATHLHFAAVTGMDGAEAEAVLTDARRTATFALEADASSAGAWGTFARYVPLGAVHVWGGLDHLAFILALVLLGRRLLPIALAAGGFTLGHTATLALAALGVVEPHTPTVEALIGFTVAFVALEAGADGPERLTRWSTPVAAGLAVLAAAAGAGAVRLTPVAPAGLAVFAYAYPRGFPRGAAAAPWLAAAFGLVHGCGFAGTLGDLDLPRPRLLSALAGFNVGVELAQLAVVGAALAGGGLWRRWGPRRVAWAPDAAAAGLFALGVYWFASRTIAA